MGHRVSGIGSTLVATNSVGDERGEPEMATGAMSLAKVYAGWEDYHKLLVRAIAPLSREQLALRPAPHLRSVGENAAHIVRARAGWYSTALGVGDEAFAAFGGYDRDGTAERSADELVEALEATWMVVARALASWTTENLDDTLRGVRHGQPFELQRGWVVWHVFEHDMHHGGEISLTLGMHGLSGLDL